MTLATGVVVTLVVWAVSLVDAVRLRALIYSLPLPMMLVLLATGIRVGAQQLIGVVLLYLFVALVAWLHTRRRWHILLADAAGVAGYVAGSWLLLRAGDLPFAPVLATTVAAWLLVVRWRRPAAAGAGIEAGPVPGQRPGRGVRAALGKLSLIAGGALVTVGLGQLLRGMVVTFPYAGVLVVVETRQQLAEFRDHFARNSLGLIAFVTGFHALQDISRPWAFAAGFAAFLSSAALLHLART